jgi:exocyst complex component 7
MGEGVQVGKGARNDEAGHASIMEHFVCELFTTFAFFSDRAKGIVDDVVTTTINSLATLSRTSRRPAFGSIFLLNNVCSL